MKNCHFLFIIIALLFAACKKDVDEFIPNPTPGVEINYIITNIGGKITDENNQPLAFVTIEVNGRNNIINTTTDENGIFLVRNIEVRKDRLYIKAQSEGFFDGSKTISVQENTIETIEIKLLEKGFNGEFNSDVGGEITTNDGAKVTFAPNTIGDSNGNPYSGSVHIAARWLNPTSADIFSIMPGNLIGEDSEGFEYVLATAGMMAVELWSPDNEKLNLLDGKTAELRFPIPSALSNVAPSKIPLWSFDEIQGIWVLEGEALRSGETYIATVTHFSFWNCDALFSVVNGTGNSR